MRFCQIVLDEAGITLNKNTIPFEPPRHSRPAASGWARRQ